MRPRARGSRGPAQRPPSATGLSLRDGHGLDLDHHRRVGKAAHRDRGARRKVAPEDLGAKLRHARGVACVDEAYGHRHEIGETAASFGERPLNVAERLAALRVEVAGERASGVVLVAGVPGDPHDASRALGDDGGREGALLLPGAANEALFHLENGFSRSRRRFASWATDRSKSWSRGVFFSTYVK